MGNLYANDFNTTVKTYYTELKKCKPLTREKERELIIKAKNGDLDAQNEVLSANLKFVFSIASRYKGKGASIPDLISEGNMGLIKAMEKFDVSKDVKFISYAVWWIRNSMQEFIKKRQSIFSYEKDDDILYNTQSSNILYDTEDEYVLKQDTVEDYDDNEELKEMSEKQRMIVDTLLSKLDERETFIVKSYYGIGIKEEMNLEEIGRVLNITKERVRQIKSVAMSKLRSEILMIEGADLLF